MNDHEVLDYHQRPDCRAAVLTKSVQTGGEVVRMTTHIDPVEDEARRCDHDAGPFIGGKRRRQFPGDAYP